jgi:hypothetical protein
VSAGTAIPWRHWVKKAIFSAVTEGTHCGLSPAAQVRAIYWRALPPFPATRRARKRAGSGCRVRCRRGPTGASGHYHPIYSAANPEVRPWHTAVRKPRSNVSIVSLGLW